MNSTNGFRNLTIGLIVLWLGIFAFFPNVIVFALSFMSSTDTALAEASFSWGGYAQLFDPIYGRILLHSFYMAGTATLICLAVGYPFAYLITTLPQKTRMFFLFLIILPFWTNSLIRVYALKMLFGFNGLLNQFLMYLGLIQEPFAFIYTEFAVIIGLVYLLLPFMILPLYSSIEKLDHSLLEAAKDLGAKPLARFWHVIIPQTMPGIIAGILLVFLPALGMFYIADLLGGAKNLMVGNIIKHQFLNTRDWPSGAAMSIMLTVLMAVFLYVYYRTNYTLRKTKRQSK